MQLTRRQFLRALAFLPALVLPDLAHAQEPGETHKVYLPLVSGDGNVTVPDGCSTDPVLALVCANGDRLDLLTWEAGFELDDPGWRPQVAQFKGGGSYSNSQIAEGQTLVAGEYDNVVETIPLIGRGTDEAKCIQTYRHLQQFIKRAADYWKEPSEYDCVWLEARPAGEGCRTGYARVIKATCADFANPFGQPFFSQQAMSVADGLSLVVEREPLWRAVPPGEMVGPLYNLLKNPDFEDWNSGVADSQPDCWDDLETFWIIGDNSRDSDPKWGRYCLKVHSGNSVQANGAKGVTQTVEGIEDGQEYTVVAWIRNGGVLQGVGRLLVTSLLGQYEVYRESARHGWELHTFTFTAGVGDVIGVNCEILSTAAGCDGEVFFDSLMVLKGDWEEEAIAQVLPYMTSSHIVNHWDTGEGDINFVDCWEVPGDVDALVKLEFQNNTTPASLSNPIEVYETIRVGQRRTQTVQNFDNYEDPFGVADATASNSDRATFSLTTGKIQVVSNLITNTGDNMGRFRAFARVQDTRAGAANSFLTLRYFLGSAGYQDKILREVAVPLRGSYCIVDLTPTAAVIYGNKFAGVPPSQLGYILEARRAAGTDNFYMDYVLLLPTDGGIVIATLDPPLPRGLALSLDSATGSEFIGVTGKKVGYIASFQTGSNSIQDFEAFNGDFFAASLTGATGGVLKKSGEAWNSVVTDSCAALAVYNGKLYAARRRNPIVFLADVLSTSDGTTWSSTFSVPVLQKTIYCLASYGGYLWIGLDNFATGDGEIYTWDGAALVLSATFPTTPICFTIYRSELLAGFQGSGDIFRYTGGAWIPFLATGETDIVCMADYQGQLFIGTGINGRIFSYDGAALTLVYDASLTRPTPATIPSMTIFDGSLYAIIYDNVVSSNVIKMNADQTWDTIYTPFENEQFYRVAGFEGMLFIGTLETGVASIYTVVPDQEMYSIIRYEGKSFTAPNRRLRDDERRHRWVFSYDRSDGSNVIGDKALIGIGYVPRYLGLLGEG